MKVLTTSKDNDQITMVIFETFQEARDLLKVTEAGRKSLNKNTRAYKIADELYKTLECWQT